MASGWYPLDPRRPEGKVLQKIIGDLENFLEHEAPNACNNDQPDNAAMDGGYVTYMELAVELLQRCIERLP